MMKLSVPMLSMVFCDPYPRLSKFALKGPVGVKSNSSSFPTPNNSFKSRKSKVTILISSPKSVIALAGNST